MGERVMWRMRDWVMWRMGDVENGRVGDRVTRRMRLVISSKRIPNI
jgi:hypothetical protein